MVRKTQRLVVVHSMNRELSFDNMDMMLDACKAPYCKPGLILLRMG